MRGQGRESHCGQKVFMDEVAFEWGLDGGVESMLGKEK